MKRIVLIVLICLSLCACGKQEGGHFAYAAAKGQKQPAKDAGHGAGQHAANDGAQHAGPQSQSSLFVALRHCQESLLGGAHEQRKYHDGQRAGT